MRVGWVGDTAELATAAMGGGDRRAAEVAVVDVDVDVDVGNCT